MFHLLHKIGIFTCFILLISDNAYSSMKLEDEGVSQGYINEINLVGAGVIAARSGIKGTINISAVSMGDTPSTPTSTGIEGQIAKDANYLYVCIATNTWKRVTISTWAVTDRLLLSDSTSHILLDDGASKILIRL